MISSKDIGKISMDDWCEIDEDMPWSGCWREIGQIDCETGDEFEADQPIGELRLTPESVYSVTWHPFEFYTDYAGSYKIKETEGTITFSQTDASGFDGEGFYLIRENGDLELIDIWFGSFYSDVSDDISCGYVFRSK